MFFKQFPNLQKQLQKFNSENIGKKRELSVVERGKIVTLNEEKYSERKISKVLKFSKTAIHQEIVKFQNFSFQDLYRFGRPRVTFKKDDHLMKRMVVCSPTSSSKKIKLPSLIKGTVVNKTTIKHRLNDEFMLKSYKPTKKPRLTCFMICFCQGSRGSGH